MSKHNVEAYGSRVFEGWREATGETWERYVDHEFVRGLGDGSLQHAAFISYLIQDYIFLAHFSRAWAMVVVKADTISQMRIAATKINGLINGEVQLHTGICAQQGLSEQDLMEAVEARENIAYTRYVMDTGLSGDVLDLLAVLSPCVFGYHEIGVNLVDKRDTRPEYRQWIDSYSDSGYMDVCQSVAVLIEETAAMRLGADPLSSPRWGALCKQFNTATELEIDFWQMGLRLGAL